MRPNTFHPENSPWDTPAEKLSAAEQERAHDNDTPPTPGDLFFETGIILAVALGAGFAVQLFLGAA